MVGVNFHKQFLEQNLNDIINLNLKNLLSETARNVFIF